MLQRRENLDGFKDTLAKARKVVHSIFPRELSPTRMLEKLQKESAQKKQAKAQKQIDAIASDQAAKDEALNAQMNALLAKLKNEPAMSLTNASDVSPVTSGARVATSPGHLPWMIAGVALVGAVVYLSRKGKQK